MLFLYEYDSEEELLKIADERMYANKRTRKKEAAENVSEDR